MDFDEFETSRTTSTDSEDEGAPGQPAPAPAPEAAAHEGPAAAAAAGVPDGYDMQIADMEHLDPEGAVADWEVEMEDEEAGREEGMDGVDCVFEMVIVPLYFIIDVAFGALELIGEHWGAFRLIVRF